MFSLDFKLLGGDFEFVAPEHAYMCKYFREGLPRTFLRYYLVFGDLWHKGSAYLMHRCFVDHTGLAVSHQRLRFLLKRIDLLQRTVERAESEFDLELLGRIKGGKWKWESEKSEKSS